MDFRTALIEAYQKNPGRVLPNACWKTLSKVNKMETRFEAIDGQITALDMWDKERLLVYWRQSLSEVDFSHIPINKLALTLIHKDYLPFFPVEYFSRKTGYFRYTHKLNNIPATQLPEGFVFSTVDLSKQYEYVADVINRSYPHLSLTPNIVLEWAKHPVYQPELWIWVINTQTQQPAGLGIAEFDPQINEGSLEWIQILPEYQGSGLGKAIVLELIRLLQGQAVFATVSGEIENSSNPSKLYRRCGFEGDDLWYLLTTTF